VKLRVVAPGSQASVKEHLTKVWQQTGHKPKELDIAPAPEGMGYLVGLFWDCKRSAEPLTYGEIESWSRLTGQTLDPDEVWCLMRLDDAHGRAVRG